MQAVVEAEYFNLKCDYVYLFQRKTHSREILQKSLPSPECKERSRSLAIGRINYVNRTVVFL